MKEEQTYGHGRLIILAENILQKVLVSWKIYTATGRIKEDFVY